MKRKLLAIYIIWRATEPGFLLGLGFNISDKERKPASLSAKFWASWVLENPAPELQTRIARFNLRN